MSTTTVTESVYVCMFNYSPSPLSFLYNDGYYDGGTYWRKEEEEEEEVAIAWRVEGNWTTVSNRLFSIEFGKLQCASIDFFAMNWISIFLWGEGGIGMMGVRKNEFNVDRFCLPVNALENV